MRSSSRLTGPPPAGTDGGATVTTPMRVASIGLGSFAEKAYLEHLSALPDVELHACTRDSTRLAWLGDRFGIRHLHQSVDSVIEAGVTAALVHAATAAHVPVVSALLTAGVHVYVDKPLADNLQDAEALVQLAEEERRSLMVGFNRRYAPHYAALRECSRPVITMSKHRQGLPTDVREFAFGDFIHVVDTLRFLAPGPVERHEPQVHLTDGIPQVVGLTLTGARFMAVGVSQRIASGAAETVEAVGTDGATRRVVDLDTVITSRGTDEQITKRAMWSRTPWQRGSEQIVDAFLAAVAQGTVLSARDALASHAICEEIVTLANG